MAPGDPAIAALRCSGLRVAAGGETILRDLDLTIADGCRTVLVGPSGAGKTTLLRAICGLAPLAAGSIELGGRRIDTLPAHRRRCAVVFQEPRLLAHLDVLDNVAFGLRAAGVGRAERRARARALLADVGLDGLPGRGVAGLSGGEQQRVALARALCVEPELLLLDEPLAAVDPNRRAALRELIVLLQRERGVSTLIITHDRDEAAELAERLAVMLEGRIVGHDTPQALFERPASAPVARFLGAEVLRGEVEGGEMRFAEGALTVGGEDGPGAVAVAPESVTLDPVGPLQLTVVEATYVGRAVRVVLRGPTLELEARCAVGESPPVGTEVRVRIDGAWRIADGEPAGAEPLAPVERAR